MGLFSTKLSAKNLVLLCRQLATSYGGGIPILRTLQLVSENIKDKRCQAILHDMYDDIRQGATLSEAARRQEKYLPRLFIELLRSGEMGGKLDVMLRDLATYYEDRLTMRRRIVGKMAYPMFQLTVAWFLGTFSLMIIGRIGERFNLTQFLHSYVRFQVGSMMIAAVALAGAVVLSRAGLLGWVSGLVTSYLWPLSPVTRRFALARVFRSLSFLLGSGMPVTRAMEGAISTASNPYIEKDLSTAIPRVRNGATMAEAFAPCRFMTAQTHEMLLVGEESGKQEDALRKASDYHMEEASHAVDIAVRVGEVLLILSVACVVGYIVISFYSKYLGMLDGIK